MEGDRGIMLQDSEEKEAKRGRDGEEEKKRGGLKEGRAGTREGGGRADNKKGSEKVEDRIMPDAERKRLKGMGRQKLRASVPTERLLRREEARPESNQGLQLAGSTEKIVVFPQ